MLPSETARTVLSLGLLGVAVLISWKLVPKFFQTVAIGAVAGAIAGGLILGPGFRIAMRIVAIMDPIRRNEFTIGGTFFIIVGVGVIFGALVGLTSILIRRGLGMGRTGATMVGAALMMLFIFSDSELRRELFELGGGAWINIPMFGAVAVGYSYSTQRLWEKLRRIAAKDDSVAEVSV